MTSRPNALSAFGRMGYGAHLVAYPAILAVYLYVVKPYMKNSADKQEKEQWESMPKARKVDPDLFNPFTPIPYHNSVEAKYAFSHIRMHGYLNENHINSAEYVWKGFHNSYDHNNELCYAYNWVSLHSKLDNQKTYHHCHALRQ
jgi:hypothetical protein